LQEGRENANSGFWAVYGVGLQGLENHDANHPDEIGATERSFGQLLGLPLMLLTRWSEVNQFVAFAIRCSATTDDNK